MNVILILLLWIFPFLTIAGIGAGSSCCRLALEAFAYVDKTIPHDKYICGQGYGQNIPPAPYLSVLTSWCRQNCQGYALTPPSDKNGWANPLFQYILPAVLFSMTTPQRLILEPPKWFFDFNVHHLPGLIKALFSLCIAGLIVTLDTTLWVFTIMSAPGPFIFSGLVEAVLDYRIVSHLLSSHTPPGESACHSLSRSERVQLLTAVLAGNLGIAGAPVNPQIELDAAMDINHEPQQVGVNLRSMLNCQYPFGAGVGGPILFYIGSFVFTLASLHDAEGDRDTARTLAFGIWWMNMIHVAAISGCLLASNNPSTAVVVVKKRRIKINLEDRLDHARDHLQMEDRVQARIEAWSRLPLVYKARYEPVWMWNRGKNKAEWLRGTAAWKQVWFREKIEMTAQGWMFLALAAYLLVLFPSALGWWIEYISPPVGPGCRSMTILVHACAQFIFVTLSAWSHFKASKTDDYWNRHPWLRAIKRSWLGVIVAIFCLLPAWVAALFTTFAGTLMQISGIYNNCLCHSTGYWSFPPRSTVALSTDTAYDRLSSRHWIRSGYAALIFLAPIAYLSWWFQRYLRQKFTERVEHLFHDGCHKLGANLVTARQTTQHVSVTPMSESDTIRNSNPGSLESGFHNV